MEEKKATPYRRVGIRLFNAMSNAQFQLAVKAQAVLLRVAFFSSTFWVFRRAGPSACRRCIEQPNSNPTIRSGFFFLPSRAAVFTFRPVYMLCDKSAAFNISWPGYLRTAVDSAGEVVHVVFVVVSYIAPSWLVALRFSFG